MRDPSYIEYRKEAGSEIKTGFATSLTQLNAMLDECIELGYEIVKVHITENPKAY